MYAWIVRSMIRRAVRQQNAGDIEAVLAAFADDARFVFPGRHSWGADLRGKDEIERWLRRLVQAGVQFDPPEVIVQGWPWDTTVCIRLTDHVTSPDGEVVYANRAFEYAKIRWGKIKFVEVYEDTQKAAELDEYLASHERSAREGSAAQ